MTVRNRSRSNSADSLDTWIERSTWNSAGAYWNDPYSTYSSAFTPESTVESMTDIVTTGFKKRSARGEIINNPMTQIKTYEYQNSIDYSFEYILRFKSTGAISAGAKDNGFVAGVYPAQLRGYGGYIAVPAYDDNDLESLKGQAIAKAYSNIDTSDTLALVTALEMGKTLTSLGSILKNVTKVYKHCLRASAKMNRSNAYRDFRLYADLWMEARYSLRPLYYDVIGLAKAIDRPLSKLDRATFRGSQVYEDNDESHDQVPLSDSGHTGSSFSVDRTSSIRVAARSGCLCKVEPETRATSLGLSEIPKSLWEIVPFSFIVDWFFNVGDIIGAWTPRMGSSVLASWVVVTTTKTQTVLMSPPLNGTPTDFSTTYSSGAGYTWGSGIKTKVEITKERSPNPSRPILPSFDVNLSPAKLLDLGIIVSNFHRVSNSLKLRI